MKYTIITLLVSFGITHCAKAQIQQVKHVVCNGGNINLGPTYTSFSVVGQLAASEFSNGSFSGSIGYLDVSDNNPYSVSKIEYANLLFKVYPNPSSGEVWVDFKTDNANEILLSVNNAIGENIYRKNFTKTDSHHVLLKKELFLVAGVYTVTIHHENSMYTQKITIIK